MFHSTAIRLTVWYLIIIMSLSIGFSLAIYNLSSDELARNVRRQISYFDNVLGPTDQSAYTRLRLRLLSEDQAHLKGNLIVFNLFVLATGGAVSYALARRNLRPIEESLKSQTRFTSDASHQLRTPLAAIQVENEVALRDPNLTKAQAKKLLHSNLEEVAKLKALSDGLLSLASAGGKEDMDQMVPVKDIVQDAIKRVEKTAKLKKIKIISDASDVNVRGNSQSLTDLLVVLIDNAVKYSPPGSRVKIIGKIKDKNVIVSVADQGVGIKNSELPHIFERFYRANNPQSKEIAHGYGLGLAIAKKISDQHNGSIEVKSTPGKGSTFSVYLPAF